MMRRIARLALPATALLVALLLAALLPEARERWRRMRLWGDHTGYNLLLVTLDTTRADFLSCYNRKIASMPGLDGAADGAVVFEAATAPTTTTVPSHASILTGVYPSEHGVVHNVQSLDSSWVSLAEIFERAGYRTAAFLSARGIIGKNLSQGFELVDDEVPAGSPLDWQRSAAETNEHALPWLGAHAAERFFLWVHYYDPHSPVPLAESARAKAPGYRGPFCNGARVEEIPGYAGVDTLAPEDFAFLRLLYEAEVRTMDRAIGHLLGMLDSLGIAGRTVVVIAGDHGQSLGEKGYIGHDGDLLHEPLVRVPLLLCLPPAPRGVEGEPSGVPVLRRRVSESVSLCDILPTVLALFPSLESPPYPLSGRSLLPLCGRFGDRGSERRVVFSEAPADLRGSRLVPRRIFAARHGRWKLVSGPDGAMLYDLRTDPREERPRDPRSKEALRLAEELAIRAARTTGDETPEAVPAAGADGEVLEALRALGYVR